MEIPMEMHKLQGTWCLDCGPDGLLWVNGEVIKRKFLSQAMKVSCGCMVSGSKNASYHYVGTLEDAPTNILACNYGAGN